MACVGGQVEISVHMFFFVWTFFACHIIYNTMDNHILQSMKDTCQEIRDLKHVVERLVDVVSDIEALLVSKSQTRTPDWGTPPLNRWS